MRIVITGANGFIGRRLTLALLERNRLAVSDETIDEIILFDRVPPQASTTGAPLPDDPRLRIASGDIGDVDAVRRLISPDTALVYHLAAIVSAEAEQDFDLGLRVNLDGTRNVLEACRAAGTSPRLVFASSVAVYGGTVPSMLDDLTILTPQTSYGTQKAAGELLVSDYSRKGHVDGRALRLPTVVVRPGRPNKAASTFASSILREPLQGESVACPVPPEQAMYILSPRRVVDALLRAAEIPEETWGAERGLLLPGITCSVVEMLAGLKAVAGDAVANRVRWEPDEAIRAIVAGWPTRFRADRARRLGFEADGGVEEIIRAFIDDELGGSFVR